jgi:hypothetical protein
MPADEIGMQVRFQVRFNDVLDLQALRACLVDISDTSRCGSTTQATPSEPSM